MGTCTFISSESRRVEWKGHMIGGWLTLKNCQTVFHSIFIVLFSNQSCRKVPVAPYPGMVSLFKFSYSNRYVVVPNFGFNFFL